MARTYKCAVCGGEYECGWSDEEALAELARDFPGFGPEDCDLVCDDCHRQITTNPLPPTPED